MATEKMQQTIDMIQMGIEKGTDQAVMEMLFDRLKEQEEMDRECEYNAALARFRRDCPPIVKDKVVDFTTLKGNTHYRHADLHTLTRTIKDVEEACGLSHQFFPSSAKEVVDGREVWTVTVTAVLSHNKGCSRNATLHSSSDGSGGKNSTQAIGSATTYLERYLLMGLLGLASTEEDDDGETSGKRGNDEAKAKAKVGADAEGRAEFMSACNAAAGVKSLTNTAYHSLYAIARLSAPDRESWCFPEAKEWIAVRKVELRNGIWVANGAEGISEFVGEAQQKRPFTADELVALWSLAFIGAGTNSHDARLKWLKGKNITISEDGTIHTE